MINHKRDANVIRNITGASFSSVVERSLRDRRIDPSWGPIELILAPASAPRLWYVLSCLWGGAYKTRVANWK